MFPFQNNNPFFPFNVDLSSSQYLPKQEIPPRMPQMYTPDSLPAYNNLPSLLNKRPSPVDINSAPVKMVHQEAFPFAGDIYSARELPKSLVSAQKPEAIDPQKLLYRSQQDLYGIPKGLALNTQQFPGLANGLGFPGIDISPIEAQAYLGDNSSQAYIRQYLESKGMNARDYGAQMQQQNDGMQRYLASLYGLQGAAVPANIGLQNLTGLEGLGNLGGLAGLGGLGNLGNIGQPGVADLLSQLRNQQMLQQLNQSLSLQLIPGLPETLKVDPNSLRNPNWADLMLLNSAAGVQPNNLLNSLQSFNLGPSPIQQSLSPPPLNNKNAPQGMVLQKPEPIRQPEPIAARKEVVNGSSKQIPALQEMSEVKAMPFGNSENRVRKENIPEKIARQNRVEPEPREVNKPVRSEREGDRILAKQQQEARNKRAEMPQQQQQQPHYQNTSVRQQQQQHQQQQIQKPIDMASDRKRASGPVIQNEQPERVISTEKLSKKVIMPGNERIQKPANFEGAAETRQQIYSQSQPVNRNRKNEAALGVESNRFGQRQEKMVAEPEQRKISPLTDPHTEFLKKVGSHTEVENYHHHIQEHEHERIDPIPEFTGINRDHSLTGEINTHQHAPAGENFYKTPERVEEEHVAQKIIETRIGQGYQSEIPELTLNQDDDDHWRRRMCKLNWDPEYANSKEVIGYLKGLHRVLGAKVINQERALQLLAKKNFNIEEVLNTIRKNERYYANFFGISNCTRELRSRRSVE